MREYLNATHATEFWGELTWKSRVVVTWHPSARAFQSIILPMAMYEGVLNEYCRCLSRFYHDDGFAIRQWSKGLIFKISRVGERGLWVYLIRYDVCVRAWMTCVANVDWQKQSIKEIRTARDAEFQCKRDKKLSIV